MVVALSCYPVLSYAGGPVWAVAAGSAAVGVWLSWHHNIASPGGLAASLSWQIMIFLFCVFVIVLGLRNVGLVDRITELYSSAISPAAKVAVIGISSVIGSAEPYALDGRIGTMTKRWIEVEKSAAATHTHHDARVS